MARPRLGDSARTYLVGAKVSRPIKEAITAARGQQSESAWVRDLITTALGPIATHDHEMKLSATRFENGVVYREYACSCGLREGAPR